MKKSSRSSPDGARGRKRKLGSNPNHEKHTLKQRAKSPKTRGKTSITVKKIEKDKKNVEKSRTYDNKNNLRMRNNDTGINQKFYFSELPPNQQKNILKDEVENLYDKVCFLRDELHYRQEEVYVQKLRMKQSENKVIKKACLDSELSAEIVRLRFQSQDLSDQEYRIRELISHKNLSNLRSELFDHKNELRRLQKESVVYDEKIAQVQSILDDYTSTEYHKEMEVIVNRHDELKEKLKQKVKEHNELKEELAQLKRDIAIEENNKNNLKIESSNEIVQLLQQLNKLKDTKADLLLKLEKQRNNFENEIQSVSSSSQLSSKEVMQKNLLAEINTINLMISNKPNHKTSKNRNKGIHPPETSRLSSSHRSIRSRTNNSNRENSNYAELNSPMNPRRKKHLQQSNNEKSASKTEEISQGVLETNINHKIDAATNNNNKEEIKDLDNHDNEIEDSKISNNESDNNNNDNNYNYNESDNEDSDDHCSDNIAKNDKSSNNDININNDETNSNNSNDINNKTNDNSNNNTYSHSNDSSLNENHEKAIHDSENENKSNSGKSHKSSLNDEDNSQSQKQSEDDNELDEQTGQISQEDLDEKTSLNRKSSNDQIKLSNQPTLDSSLRQLLETQNSPNPNDNTFDETEIAAKIEQLEKESQYGDKNESNHESSPNEKENESENNSNQGDLDSSIISKSSSALNEDLNSSTNDSILKNDESSDEKDDNKSNEDGEDDDSNNKDENRNFDDHDEKDNNEDLESSIKEKNVDLGEEEKNSNDNKVEDKDSFSKEENNNFDEDNNNDHNDEAEVAHILALSENETDTSSNKSSKLSTSTNNDTDLSTEQKSDADQNENNKIDNDTNDADEDKKEQSDDDMFGQLKFDSDNNGDFW